MRLFRFDDPTRKPDLSRLNDHTRFLHPRYHRCVFDYVLNECAGTDLRNAAGPNPSTVAYNNILWSETQAGPALDLDGSSSSYRWSPSVITAPPFTMAVGFITDTLSQAGTLFSLSNSTVVSQQFAIIQVRAVDFSDGDDILFFTRSGGSYTAASPVATKTVSLDTVHVAVATAQSTSSRTIWLDGANSATNTTSISPIGIDNFAIGRLNDSTPSTYFDGKILFARAWSRVLSDSEIQALSDAPYLEYYPTRSWWFVPSAASTSTTSRYFPLLGVG